MALPAIADGFFVLPIGRRAEFPIRVNETMTEKNVAEVLADVLAEAGVERLCGVAGDSLTGVTDTLRCANCLTKTLSTWRAYSTLRLGRTSAMP